MKKILLILIGFTAGIIAALILALSHIVPFRYVFDERPGVASVKDLMIINADEFYGITLNGNTNLIVSITVSPDRQVISDISIFNPRAREYQDFSFSDTDLNGMFDRWTFSDDKSMYMYGRTNGYPDTIYNSETDETTVRIDNEYHLIHEKDKKKYIDKNDDLIEIVHVTNCLYTIK